LVHKHTRKLSLFHTHAHSLTHTHAHIDANMEARTHERTTDRCTNARPHKRIDAQTHTCRDREGENKQVHHHEIKRGITLEKTRISGGLPAEEGKWKGQKKKERSTGQNLQGLCIHTHTPFRHCQNPVKSLGAVHLRRAGLALGHLDSFHDGAIRLSHRPPFLDGPILLSHCPHLNCAQQGCQTHAWTSAFCRCWFDFCLPLLESAVAASALSVSSPLVWPGLSSFPLGLRRLPPLEAC